MKPNEIKREVRDILASRIVQPGVIDAVNMARIRRLLERYNRFSHYMTETRHQWTLDPGSVVNYGDTSEGEEISLKTGERRRAILVPPRGARRQ